MLRTLEIRERRGLVGERCEKLRVERIPFAESHDALGDRVVLGQGVAIVLPKSRYISTTTPAAMQKSLKDVRADTLSAPAIWSAMNWFSWL